MRHWEIGVGQENFEVTRDIPGGLYLNVKARGKHYEVHKVTGGYKQLKLY